MPINPDQAFQLANGMALAGWVSLLASPLIPRWSERIAGIAIPLLLGAGYAAIVLVFWSRGEGGFDTLDNVAALFRSRELLLAGWIHYLAFDLFIGAWQARTAAKADRLTFQVGDINALDLPAAAYDAILSIDAIYFSDDYEATIRQLLAALRPSGHLAFFYAHGILPGVSVADFQPETLTPARTPLAVALQATGLTFTTTDFTDEEYRLAQLRKTVLTELEPAFAAEEILFIFENRMGEAQGISRAIERGLHRRYLYIVNPQQF